MQKKKCCALQENVVSKQLTLYDQERTDQYVVDCKAWINRVALVNVDVSEKMANQYTVLKL